MWLLAGGALVLLLGGFSLYMWAGRDQHYLRGRFVFNRRATGDLKEVKVRLC